MTISVTCLQCGRTFHLAEEHAGKSAKCKACGNAVQIPVAQHAQSKPDNPGHGPRDSGSAAPPPPPFGQATPPHGPTYIDPNDYRVEGEQKSFYVGIGVVAFILLFITAMSVGILTIAIVGLTAIMVWVLQGQLIGGCAKVSPKQFPNIFRLAEVAAERLCMRRPEIFIKYDPTINAAAIGFLGKKSVILNSATVEAMGDDELLHIIGHEFSHIKCGHTNLVVITNSTQGISVPIVSQILSGIFLVWSRKAEYTCDRGGLLVSRNPKTCISAMCKIAVGPTLFEELDIEDFLNQRTDLDQNDVSKLSEYVATHPYLVKRIHAIQAYFGSADYTRITGMADAVIRL